MDIIIRKSPLTPLYQRGVIPPFGKGRSGGILEINVFTIMRPLITDVSNKPGILCIHATYLPFADKEEEVITA